MVPGFVDVYKRQVYINGNGYLQGAPAYDREQDLYFSEEDPQIRIAEENGNVYLECFVEESLLQLATETITTAKLGTTRITGCTFDAPDGTPLQIDRDYLGNTRSSSPTAGPIEHLAPGWNRILVWKK